MSAPVSLQIILGFLLFALVFVPLERWFPLRAQPTFRPGWKADIAYYVMGCLAGYLSNGACLATALLIRRAMRLNHGIAASQPGWIQFLEIIVVADFLAYLFHRALHRYAWLWKFHKVHHSSRQLDWLANSRIHPVDKILGDCCQFVPIFCLGFADGPVLAYTILLGFQAFLNHSNIRINFGPLRWIIASPAFHHWHHGNEPSVYDKNFAPHLVVFDLLFGTAHIPPGSDRPLKYGLVENVPEGFWRQTAYPFRRKPSDIL